MSLSEKDILWLRDVCSGITSASEGVAPLTVVPLFDFSQA